MNYNTIHTNYMGYPAITPTPPGNLLPCPVPLPAQALVSVSLGRALGEYRDLLGCLGGRQRSIN